MKVEKLEAFHSFFEHGSYLINNFAILMIFLFFRLFLHNFWLFFLFSVLFLNLQSIFLIFFPPEVFFNGGEGLNIKLEIIHSFFDILERNLLSFFLENFL